LFWKQKEGPVTIIVTTCYGLGLVAGRIGLRLFTIDKVASLKKQLEVFTFHLGTANETVSDLRIEYLIGQLILPFFMLLMYHCTGYNFRKKDNQRIS